MYVYIQSNIFVSDLYVRHVQISIANYNIKHRVTWGSPAPVRETLFSDSVEVYILCI